MVPQIVAGSVGFVTAPDGTLRPGIAVQEAIRRCRHPSRPRFCYLGTAAQDRPERAEAVRRALGDFGGEFAAPALTQPLDPAGVREQLARQDVIWADGGSGAYLLSVWHRLGIEAALRDAWQSGTVMAGISAGAICWHVGGTPDWAEPRDQAILGGLGLVPFGAGVHYQDGRRPVLQQLVRSGVLPASSYATDDGAALIYEDDRVAGAIADREEARAYLVQRQADGGAAESVLPVRRVTGPA
jgi:peptidase E